MWSNGRAALAAALAAGFPAACRAAAPAAIPGAQRDVAPIVGDTFSTEDARDRLGEAEQVMQLAGVKPACGSPTSAPGRAIIRFASRASSGQGQGARRRHRARGDRPAHRARAARAARQCRGQARTPDDPMLPPQRSTGFSSSTCITRSPRPTPSCGTCARAEAGRAGRRGRGRPAGEPPRNAARRS